MIGRARVDLARSDRIELLSRAGTWKASSRQARETLLDLLAHETDSRKADELVGGLVRLDPTAEDKRQAREALLGSLAAGQTSARAAALAQGLIHLDPTVEEKRQAREVLLRLLAEETNPLDANSLASGLARLASTAEDKRQAREALLRLLTADQAYDGAALYKYVPAFLAWRMSLASSTRPRRTGARRGRFCLGCSQTILTHMLSCGWWRGWLGSIRRRRTSVRPGRRCLDFSGTVPALG